MNKTKRISIAAAVLTAFAFPVLAAGSGALPAPVKGAIDGGMKLEKSFEAAGGLTGWVLSQGPNSNFILFTPPGGEVAIVGNMFDANGTNLNKQYLEQHAPKPDFSKMWGQLESSSWIAEGPKNAKNVIYVFEDANCGYCHLAWKALRPYTKAGLQVRWIPVAFLGQDSSHKAAAIMTASDPAVAMAEMQENFGKKMPPLKAPSDAIKAKLDANGKLMKDLGMSGTPATFYKDKAGNVRMLAGMFNLSNLPEITGLPEIKNTDPALARFR